MQTLASATGAPLLDGSGYERTATFGSLGDLVAYAKADANESTLRRYGVTEDCITRLAYGVPGGRDLEIAAAHAQRALQDEIHTLTPSATYDVTGAVVDVARYLSGEPECMIDFPLAELPSFGNFIRVVANIGICPVCAPSQETIRRRGEVIASLVVSLDAAGYGVEVWADSVQNGLSVRWPIRLATDALDVDVLYYALAKPEAYQSVACGIHECITPRGPGTYRQKAVPESTVENFPEGTVYFPELCGASYRADEGTADWIKRYIRQLGLMD